MKTKTLLEEVNFRSPQLLVDPLLFSRLYRRSSLQLQDS